MLTQKFRREERKSIDKAASILKPSRKHSLACFMLTLSTTNVIVEVQDMSGSVLVRTLLITVVLFFETITGALAYSSGSVYGFTGTVHYQFLSQGSQIRIWADSVSDLCPPAAYCVAFGVETMELWAFETPYPRAGIESEEPLPAGYRIASVPVSGIVNYGDSIVVDSGVTSLASPPPGTYYLSMILVGSEGVGVRHTVYWDAANFFDTVTWADPSPPPPPPQSYPKVVVAEYYNAAFDHYFITIRDREGSLLGKPPFQDWQPTGLTFNAYDPLFAPPSAGVSVCRFFNDHFAPKSTHFYAMHGLGCEQTISGFPDWALETSNAFYMLVPDNNGNCPTNSMPVYRLYNNGMGGAPNHRFTTYLNVRAQMIAAGWVPEGNGVGVTFCSPH